MPKFEISVIEANWPAYQGRSPQLDCPASVTYKVLLSLLCLRIYLLQYRQYQHHFCKIFLRNHKVTTSKAL